MRTLFIYFGIGWLFSASFAADILPGGQNNLTSTVPAKVVRYAATFMQRYDQNGDGILQQEEWEKIPGHPQSIDINGDRQITMEELVWYFAQYGRSRTIHRSVTVDLKEPYKFDPANLKLLKPVLQPPAAPPIPNTESQEQIGDRTEDLIKSNDQPIDDATYEKMVADRQIPVEKPFYTSPENLRGVPAWFILLDKNGDGQISLSEFAPTFSPAAVALFKQLDKNGNGFIEPDEVRKSP